MADNDPWPAIHAERQALASDLADMTPDQWTTPSLVPRWTVRDVLAHMTATAQMSTGKFFAGFAGSGFRFHQMSDKNIRAEEQLDPPQQLAKFASLADSNGAPPGPVDTMLTEVFVHSEDIRRPLGIAHAYDPESAVRVAEFLRGSNLLIHGKSRATGLRLRATDTDWSAGNGPEVAGPVMSIVLAVAGRPAAIDDLVGAGVATLRSRS
jgi:uncharacterized protein (TIGR03083 family)